MKTIIKKLKEYLDTTFYIVVVWHIAVAHQPEPEHDKYAVIELYEIGQYADTREFACKGFTLWEREAFLGFHLPANSVWDPLTDATFEGEDIKCRYILNRPTDWEDKLIAPW